VKTDLDSVREELRRDPDNPAALEIIARHYLEKNQYLQAKNYFIQSVRLSPRLFAKAILAYEEEIGKAPGKIGPRFSLAAFYLAWGEIDGAMLELEEILEVSPKNVQAYNVMGKIFLRQGSIDEVIALLERSMRAGVEDASLTEILAGAYLEKGRVQDAITFYQKMLTFRPVDKQILRVLGDLYTRTENFNEAARRYQAMFSDDPEVGREVVQRLEGLLKKLEGNIFVREVLADIYMRLMSPEEAVAKLLEIVRLDATCLETVVQKLRSILRGYPGHPQATLALAEALRMQGNFSEAIENYNSLAKARPEFIEQAMQGYRQVLESCPGQALAHAYLAEAYLSKKLPEESLREFEAMLEVEPSAAETVIKKCREIIRQYPDLVLARLVLGRAHLLKGDIQRAAVEAEGIVAVDKKYAAAYILMGEAYFKMNLSRKAMEAMHSALMLAPYDLNLQERYREVKEKELEMEIEKLREQIAADPWKPALHLDLASRYVEKDADDEAIRQLQAALKDLARAPQAANLLGCIYRGGGRFDLAAQQFKRAIEGASGDLRKVTEVNLGTAYEAQGLIAQAMKVYEGVLQQDIDFGELRQKVKYLKQSSLQSLKTRTLQMVPAGPRSRDILAFWGREVKAGRGGKTEEMSVSFGQDHNLAGFDFYMKGVYKAAQEEFTLAVQMDAKFSAALNNLAVALLKEGKILEAKTRLEEAVSVDPGLVILRANLGVAYFLLGMYTRAKAEMEKAYAVDSENKGIILALADIYYAEKNVEQALLLYRRVGDNDVLTEAAARRLRFRTPPPKK
jgi:tetratricopeptide (TPR) repeat protein